MAVKTITVTEDAYLAMKRIKNEDESFSDLFLRVSKKHVLTAKDLVGAISMTPHEGEEWSHRVTEHQKRMNEDFRRHMDNVRARLKRTD